MPAQECGWSLVCRRRLCTVCDRIMSSIASPARKVDMCPPMGHRRHNSCVLSMINGTVCLLERKYRPHLAVLQQLSYYLSCHMIVWIDFFISVGLSYDRLKVDSCGPLNRLDLSLFLLALVEMPKIHPCNHQSIVIHHVGTVRRNMVDVLVEALRYLF